MSPPAEAPDMQVRLGPLHLRNPVLTASGTFGYGQELARYVDVSRLGGVVCKTVTRRPRGGNPPPRTFETAAGMLNAIGLQNIGVDSFIRNKLPELRALDVPIVVNVAGETDTDFASLCADLSAHAGVAALELNISCPNVACGLDFSAEPRLTERVVRLARAATHLPLFAKLSPNVTDIAVIARAAEAGGADALSLVNTYVGMAINIRSRRPRLSNVSGGLSGPAIKPLALRAVYVCSKAVQLPLIGIGGIMNAEDAVEFMLAGATAVQVGTATFVDPCAAIKVVDGLQQYLTHSGVNCATELVGGMKV